MIIDVNSYLGRWGLRTKGIAKPEEFLKVMDKNGIDISVVTSTVALVTDTREGNLQLIKAIRPYLNRLIPVACINPVWGLKEAQVYFDNYPFKIARFSPALHNYSLKEFKMLDPFMDWLREKNIPLYITAEVCYDFGAMAGKMGFAPSVYPLSEIVSFAERYPSQRIIICGYDAQISYQVKSILIPALKEYQNLFIEISNISVAGILEKLVKEAPEQILLGTANGINYPAASISKIELAKLTKEEKEKVFFKNSEKIISQLG